MNILLVEDSEGHVRLTLEAFRITNESINVHVACDGIEAMAFLRGEGGYADAPRPDLVLLDLNMPKMNGFEVLACVKEDDDLKLIPIVVLTTSDAELDIHKSYQLSANAYLTKPVQWEEFEEVVRHIDEFWLTLVTLPPQSEQREASAASPG